MASITLEGNEIHTNGDLPAVGSQAPDFSLTNGDLADVSLADFAGKRKIFNIVPSLDTGICAASAVRFNQALADMDNTVVLVVSADLPFAAGRVCSAEGADKVTTLSMMRSKQFAEDYGVLITDGPLAGLCARAVVITDADNKIIYTELVPEIVQAPDYDAALAV